jgi:peptide-methionine (S)-S-oxide reductase
MKKAFLAFVIGAALLFMMNVAARAALPDATLDEPRAAGMKTIVLAGGCFWGIEEVFQHVKGVTAAESGYAGGSADTANYEAVSTGRTLHAEAVRVTYDPAIVTLGQLLKIYFSAAHDPTQLNKQGPDHGTQYRSAVFTGDAEQEKIVKAYIAQLESAKAFAAPVVTQVSTLETFYPAEDYHQDYARKNPFSAYIIAHDLPKVAALKKMYPELSN